jgi:serine-type D-Ala-D-Ala carboxypeptidase
MNRLQEMIEEGLSSGLYLGAAFWALRTTDGLFLEGHAGRSQEEPSSTVGDSTIWDLASLTKPIVTATSVLMLTEQGAFSLTEEVCRFLRQPAPALEGITLRHLLSHVSGLKPWEQFHSLDLGAEEILRRVRASERQRPIGTGYAYSDLGYVLLGEVVETVAGQPLNELARERIFEPLAMRDTGYLPPDTWRPRIAATRCPDRNRVLVGEVHDGNCDALSGVAGHAGLFGSARDLARYARMILGEGAWEGARILSPLSVRQMGRNQNPPGVNGHTLGWFTRPNGFLPAGDLLPEDTFGHTGFTGTSVLFSPSLGVAAALLTNRVYVERDAADFLRFRRRFHNAVAGLLGAL